MTRRPPDDPTDAAHKEYGTAGRPADSAPAAQHVPWDGPAHWRWRFWPEGEILITRSRQGGFRYWLFSSEEDDDPPTT